MCGSFVFLSCVVLLGLHARTEERDDGISSSALSLFSLNLPWPTSWYYRLGLTKRYLISLSFRSYPFYIFVFWTPAADALNADSIAKRKVILLFIILLKFHELLWKEDKNLSAYVHLYLKWKIAVTIKTQSCYSSVMKYNKLVLVFRINIYVYSF